MNPTAAPARTRAEVAPDHLRLRLPDPLRPLRVLHSRSDDVPPRWTNSASRREPGLPALFARTPAEIEVFRIHEARLRSPPRASQTGPSTSITAPIAASTSREDEWLQCVLRRGCQRSGSQPAESTRTDERGQRRRERSDARLQRQVLVQQPGHRDPDPRPAESLDQRGRTLPGRWTKASLLTSRYALPGRARAPMLLAARSRRCVDPDEDAFVEPRLTVDQFSSVGPFSTTTIRCAGTPSATAAPSPIGTCSPAGSSRRRPRSAPRSFWRRGRDGRRASGSEGRTRKASLAARCASPSLTTGWSDTPGSERVVEEDAGAAIPDARLLTTSRRA